MCLNSFLYQEVCSFELFHSKRMLISKPHLVIHDCGNSMHWIRHAARNLSTEIQITSGRCGGQSPGNEQMLSILTAADELKVMRLRSLCTASVGFCQCVPNIRYSCASTEPSCSGENTPAPTDTTHRTGTLSLLSWQNSWTLVRAWSHRLAQIVPPSTQPSDSVVYKGRAQA